MRMTYLISSPLILKLTHITTLIPLTKWAYKNLPALKFFVYITFAERKRREEKERKW